MHIPFLGSFACLLYSCWVVFSAMQFITGIMTVTAAGLMFKA